MMKKYSNELLKLKNLGQKKGSNETLIVKNVTTISAKDYSSLPNNLSNKATGSNSRSKNKSNNKASGGENNNENIASFNILSKPNSFADSGKLRKTTNSGQLEKKDLVMNTNNLSKGKTTKPVLDVGSATIQMDVDYPSFKMEKAFPLTIIEEKTNSPKFDETIVCLGDNFSRPYTSRVNHEPQAPVTNPQIPYEYLGDIFENLLLEEKSLNLKINYDSMKSQTDINDKMRAILIDWLIDVHLKFKLLPESLFLTINMIDRYISRKQVLRSKLQLLGVSALLIACKYEEIYSPELRDFVYITDKAFSKSEIIQMEQDILLTLNFDVTVPSILRFLELFALQYKFKEKDFALAKYLVEIFLIDFRVNKYSSSLIAATATYIVLKLNRDDKVSQILGFSRKSESQLKECAKDILFLLQNIEGSVLQAVKKKYSSTKYFEVSKLRLC